MPSSQTSSIASPDSFSVISSTGARSRSSSQSFHTVDDTFDSTSFSDVSPLSPVDLQSAHSFSNSEGDSDEGSDEIIVVPRGSALMASARSRSATNDSDSSAVIVNATHSSDESFAIPSDILSEVDEDESGSDDQSAGPEAEDSDDDEGGARATQRRLHEHSDVDSNGESSEPSEEEEILYAGTDAAAAPSTQHLTGAMSGLCIQPPTMSTMSLLSRSVNAVAIIRDTLVSPVPEVLSRSVSTPVRPVQTNTNPRKAAARPSAPIQDVGSDSASKTKARKERRKRAKADKKQEKRAAPSSDLSSSSSSISSETPAATSNDASFSDQEYQDAVAYVTQHLKNPPEKPSPAVHLHFLQSLVIELGLLASGTATLPTSCRAAKALLKAQVHINVKQYLAHRTHRSSTPPSTLLSKSQRKAGMTKQDLPAVDTEVGVGIAELQKIMYPSKSALMKSLRSGGKVPVKLVKKAGLDVFLVTVFR